MQLFMSIILSINTSGLKAQFVYLKKKKKKLNMRVCIFQGANRKILL